MGTAVPGGAILAAAFRLFTAAAGRGASTGRSARGGSRPGATSRKGGMPVLDVGALRRT